MFYFFNGSAGSWCVSSLCFFSCYLLHNEMPFGGGTVARQAEKNMLLKGFWDIKLMMSVLQGPSEIILLVQFGL